MSELIRLNKVSHYYPEDNRRNYTLVSLDFGVYNGEFICILGPSGCGKSTLLNLLAGFVTPSEGSISVAGKELGASQKAFRDIKVVMQHAHLFPWLTVWGNVDFGLKIRRLAKTKRSSVISDLLHLVGLIGMERKFPSQLSGGMQQRVAIARALAPDPKILLMDEPFGALDAQMRRKMQIEITRIWSMTRKTVVFVTHDIVESVLLADRIIVLSAAPGRVKSIVQVPVPRPRQKSRDVYDIVLELEGLVETIET